eukprot:GFKZ01007947.1.p1 GENE.GFKZ01007947.1~~GFKZ01007947.1.p1  ORF type:complete len:1431 (+),score=221.26 GFKZ01007947.1:144-4436(+)
MGNTVTRSHIRDVDPGVGKATRANTKKNSTGFLHEHTLSTTTALDDSPTPPSYPSPIHLSVSSSHNLSSTYTNQTPQQMSLPGYDANSVPSLPTNLSPHHTPADAPYPYYSQTNPSLDDHTTGPAPQQRPHRYHSVPSHAQSRSNFPENRHSFTYGSQRSLKSLALKPPPHPTPQPTLASYGTARSENSALKPPVPPPRLPPKPSSSSSSPSAVAIPKRRLPSSPSPVIRRKERHHGANISFSRNSSSQSIPAAVAPPLPPSPADCGDPPAAALDPLSDYGRNSSLGSRTPPFAHRSPANIDPNLPGGTVYDCQTARTQTPPRVDKPPRARKVVSFNENVHVVTYPNEGSSTHSSTAGDTPPTHHYIETKQPKRRARAVLRLLSRVTAPISQADNPHFPSPMASTSNCFSASYDTCCGLRFGDDEAAAEERNSVVMATRGSLEQRAVPDRATSLSFSREETKAAKAALNGDGRKSATEESRYSIMEGSAAVATGTIDDDFDYNERAPLDEDDDTLSLSDAHLSLDGIDEPEAIGDQLLSPVKEGRSDERESSTFDIVPLWKRLKRVDELDIVRSARSSIPRKVPEEKDSPESQNSNEKSPLRRKSEPSVREEPLKGIFAADQPLREKMPPPGPGKAGRNQEESPVQPSAVKSTAYEPVPVPAKVEGVLSVSTTLAKQCPEGSIPAAVVAEGFEAGVSTEVSEKESMSTGIRNEEQHSVSTHAPSVRCVTPASLPADSRLTSNADFVWKNRTPIAGLPSSQTAEQKECDASLSEHASKDMRGASVSCFAGPISSEEPSKVVPSVADKTGQETANESTPSSGNLMATSDQSVSSPGLSDAAKLGLGAEFAITGVTATRAVTSPLDVGSSPETISATDPASDNDPILGTSASKPEHVTKHEASSRWATSRSGVLPATNSGKAEMPSNSSGDRKVAEIIEKVPLDGKTDGTLHRPSRTADSLLHEACKLEERLLSGSRNNSIQLGDDPLELVAFPGNDTSEATLSEAIGSDRNPLSTMKESEMPSESGIGDIDIDPVCLSHDDYSVAACSPALSPLAGVYYGTHSPRGHVLGFTEELPVEISGVVDYPEYAVLNGQGIEDSVFGSEPNTPVMKATSGWDEPFKEFEIGEQFYEDSGPLRHVSYEDRLPKQSVPEVLLHDWSGSTPIEPNVEIVDSAPNSRSSDAYTHNTSPRAIEPQKDIRNTAMLLSARLNVDMSKMRSKALGDRLSSPLKQDEEIRISEVDGRIARDLSTAVGCAENRCSGDDVLRNHEESLMTAKRESESSWSAQPENTRLSSAEKGQHTARGATRADNSGLYYGAGVRLGRADPKLRDFQRSIERKSFSEMGYRTIGLANEREELLGERGGEPASDFRTFSEKTERQDSQQRHVAPPRRRRLSNMETSEGIEGEGSNPLRIVMGRLVNRMNLGKKSLAQE